MLSSVQFSAKVLELLMKIFCLDLGAFFAAQVMDRLGLWPLISG